MTPLLSLWLALAGVSPAAARMAAPPSFKKVMIVVLENTDYKKALAQPFLAQLTKGGALLADYHAVTHPSQPNYVAMISGDTQGVWSDGNFDLNARHIGDLLEAKGKTWKTYAEGYPGNCFLKKRSGKYVRKHAPFLSFKNVSGDPGRCANIVEASALDADIRNQTLPDYSLYIPDMDNDGHDTGPAYADRWLSSAFKARLNDPRFMRDMLFVVTFDEDEGGGRNQVFTLLYGPGVVPGAVSSDRCDHYSLLRTIEDAFGLGTLGLKDAAASPFTGIWK